MTDSPARTARPVSDCVKDAITKSADEAFAKAVREWMTRRRGARNPVPLETVVALQKLGVIAAPAEREPGADDDRQTHWSDPSFAAADRGDA